MCGICGIVSWSKPIDIGVVQAMNRSIAHRGPDGEGVISSGPVVFGHRRLAIIDLSENGRQPMWDHHNQVLITFNGEIYNYAFLKQELIDLGGQFNSTSDTEVILEGYKIWGLEVFSKLRGMFALALYDVRLQQVVLARDRLGKKPLFYFEMPGGIVFSSELGSILEHPSVTKDLNSQSIIDYLSIGYTMPGRSLMEGIKKVSPGTYLVYENAKSPRTFQYWDMRQYFGRKNAFVSEQEAAEELLWRLDEAVRIRLVSDVPLGAFLSGGLDSSSVVASMCQVRPAGTNHSCSVGFRERSFSELSFAEQTARELRVVHHSGVINDEGATLTLRIMGRADEPLADTSAVPMYLLSEFTKKHVTVALSGDGADELFCGYPTYIADSLHPYLSCFPRLVFQTGHAVYQRIFPRNFNKVSLDYKLLQFLDGLRLSPGEVHCRWREIIPREDLHRLANRRLRSMLEDYHPRCEFNALWLELKDLSVLDRAMYVDLNTWLLEDILVKVDRMSMAHGLEVRCPFLDHELVEFAIQLPEHFRLRRGAGKRVLRTSQAKRLSRTTLARRKSGFNAPIAHWLFGKLGSDCREMLQDSPLYDYLEPKQVRALLDDHLARKCDNSFKLFTLMSLHSWLSDVDSRRAAPSLPLALHT